MAARTVIRRRPKIMTQTLDRATVRQNSIAWADILTQVAYVFFAVLEGLLAARFILRIIAANPFSPAVTWVYNTTASFVIPFEALFPSPTSDFSVLEVSTIVAMVSYLFIFYLVVAVFRLFVDREEVVNPEGNY